jgi:hypothetical protein
VSELTDAWWFKYTTFLDERRRKADKAFWTRATFPPDEVDVRARQRAEDEYERDLFRAWDQFRPNGPLEGEVVPGEVERVNTRVRAGERDR